MDDRELDALMKEIGAARTRPVRRDFASSVRARLDRSVIARFSGWLGVSATVGWRVAPAALAVLIGGAAGFGAAHARGSDVLEAFDPSEDYREVAAFGR